MTHKNRTALPHGTLTKIAKATGFSRFAISNLLARREPIGLKKAKAFVDDAAKAGFVFSIEDVCAPWSSTNPLFARGAK
jgi:hypothetical protein